MNLSRPSSYMAQSALLAILKMATPGCTDSIPVQHGTVGTPDATKTGDASTKIGNEVAAKAKVACASLSETCGHSKDLDVCESVDKQDFAYELSVEVDKFILDFEEILKFIESRENLFDLSSKVNHKTYDDGDKYSGLEFNTGEVYGHISIEKENNGTTIITMFKNPHSPTLTGQIQTTGGDISYYFDENGKPIKIVFHGPLSLNFGAQAQCFREFAMYILSGNYPSESIDDQNTIYKYRHTGAGSLDQKANDACNDCDPAPLKCDFSQTSVNTTCVQTSSDSETQWWENSTRKLDPQVAQSLLEKLATKIEQMLKKHGITP